MGRAPSPAEGAHLVLGMLLVGVDHRPAHLSRFTALFSVLELRIACASESSSTRGKAPPAHYTPVEYTARLVYSALGKDRPDGAGSALLEGLQGALVESACDRAQEAV